MNNESVRKVRREAMKVINLCVKLESDNKIDVEVPDFHLQNKNSYPGNSMTAELRRRSMDLSKALTAMRKS